MGMQSQTLFPKTVGEEQIRDGAVTEAKLADNSVATAKVQADAIMAAQLAANSVTASEVANDAIGAAEIAANAVGTTEVANDAITAAKLAANSVTASEVAADAIGNSELADNAVAGANIQGGAISADMIGNIKVEDTHQISGDYRGQSILAKTLEMSDGIFLGAYLEVNEGVGGTSTSRARTRLTIVYGDGSTQNLETTNQYTGSDGNFSSASFSAANLNMNSYAEHGIDRIEYRTANDGVGDAGNITHRWEVSYLPVARV